MEGETAEISIGEGKNLIVTLIEVGKLLDDGSRNLTFEINGNRRTINLEDKTATVTSKARSQTLFADKNNEKEVGSSIPGQIVKINVKVGDKVKAGDTLFIAEAMKMEANVVANIDGTVKEIFVEVNDAVENGQLLLTFE